MSRIGKKPIQIPAGVDVKVAGPIVSVKGPLGKLDSKARATEGSRPQVALSRSDAIQEPIEAVIG